MADNGHDLKDIWDEVMRIAAATGVGPLNAHPGLWSCGDPESGWYVAINGHKETIDGVPYCHMLVKWNGWPAGLMTPMEGNIAAGAAANAETFIAWLRTQGREARTM